ncbi:MAG: prephenate dehydratase [Betaproteobacteria bacterium]
MRIAFQGETGSPGEAAAERVDAAAERLACRTFEDVFEAVEHRAATWGVLPLESSIAGTMFRQYDLLVQHALSIVGEVEVPGDALGLGPLARAVRDADDPLTRFIVVGRQPLPHRVSDKTTIVFSLRNEPGALFRALGAFALRDVDLAKLESRPVKGRPWESLFYADLAASRDELACAHALQHLADLAATFRILGSYQAWRGRELRPADPFEVCA